MSVLGLMSRGYICCKVPAQIISGGPVITGAAVLSPDIKGTAQTIEAAPSLIGATVQEPTVSGTVTPDPTPAGAPGFSGGSELVPIIRKAEEE